MIESITVSNSISLAVDDEVERYWLMATGIPLGLMQVGFVLFEHGAVRKKNIISILFKNVGDYAISAFVWWGIGYPLAYGTGNRFFGTSYFFLTGASNFQKAEFIQSCAYVTTCVTIISGAVTERIWLWGYYIIIIIVAGIIYPVATHWIKGDGWLTSLGANGYLDSAGGSQVHFVGGTVAILVAKVLGPRRHNDVFPPIQDHISQLLGTLLLWVSWVAFNIGSSSNSRIIILSGITTVVTSSMAVIVEVAYSKIRYGHCNLPFLNSVLLCSLVGSSSYCTYVRPHFGLAIGLMHPLVFRLFEQLRIKLKIDDVVGAFAVHSGGGVVGTISVGLFADQQLVASNSYGLLLGGGVEQLLIQLLGLVVLATWCLLAFLVAIILSKTNNLRVSYHDELIGLDIAEHGILELEGTANELDNQSALSSSVASGSVRSTECPVSSQVCGIGGGRDLELSSVTSDAYPPRKSNWWEWSFSNSKREHKKASHKISIKAGSNIDIHESNDPQPERPDYGWVLLVLLVILCFFPSLSGIISPQSVPTDIELDLSKIRELTWRFSSLLLALLIVFSRLLFEAGSVQRKFTNRIFIRIVSSQSIVVIWWYALGYLQAAGVSGNVLIGSESPLMLSHPNQYLFEYAVLFVCCSYITIAVGSTVGGIIKLNLIFSFLTMMISFPIPILIYWLRSKDSWLQQLNETGFIDGGGSFVHTISGFTSVVLSMIVGPCIATTSDGREVDPFSPEGRYKLQPSNPFLSGAAAVLEIPLFASIACSLIGNLQTSADAVISLTIAPLVSVICLIVRGQVVGYTSVRDCGSVIVCAIASISSCAGVTHPVWSVLVGVISAFICLAGRQLINNLRIADGCNIFVCHGCGGVFGSVCAALISDQTRVRMTYPNRPNATGGLFFSGNVEQFFVQMLGIIVTISWTVMWSFSCLKLSSWFLNRKLGNVGIQRYRIPVELEKSDPQNDSDALSVKDLSRLRKITSSLCRILDMIGPHSKGKNLKNCLQAFTKCYADDLDENNSNNGDVLLKKISSFRESIDRYRSYIPDSYLDHNLSKALDVIHIPEGNVVVSFTCIDGSDKLWSDHNSVTCESVKLYLSILKNLYKNHRGYLVKIIGDRAMCVFQEVCLQPLYDPILFFLIYQLFSPKQVANSVRCYCQTQVALLEATWSDSLLNMSEGREETMNDVLLWKGLKMSVGLAYGSAVLEVNDLTGKCDYLGKTANLAARLSTESKYGVTLISHSVWQELNQIDTTEFIISEVRGINLRGIGKVSAYAISYPILVQRVTRLPFDIVLTNSRRNSSVESALKHQNSFDRKLLNSKNGSRNGTILCIQLRGLSQKYMNETADFITEACNSCEGSVVAICGQTALLGFNVVGSTQEHHAAAGRCATITYREASNQKIVLSMAVSSGPVAAIPSTGMSTNKFLTAIGPVVNLSFTLSCFSSTISAFCIVSSSEKPTDTCSSSSGGGSISQSLLYTDASTKSYCRLFKIINFSNTRYQLYHFDLPEYVQKKPPNLNWKSDSQYYSTEELMKEFIADGDSDPIINYLMKRTPATCLELYPVEDLSNYDGCSCVSDAISEL